MPHTAPEDGSAAWGRALGLIAFGTFTASFSFNFWVPFLKFYMQDLGAGSEARALSWVALGMSANGVFRFVGGPFWGVLADRYGRKPMYVRALFGATVTTLTAAFATEPWHVTAAWACQGFFSGFIPAAIALTSVTVPRDRLTNAMGTVQGSQYVGTTLGPALGALMAEAVGLRVAILAAALLPALAGAVVLIGVPRDHVTRAAPVVPAAGPRPGKMHALTRDLSMQFAFGLFLYFAVFMMTQLVRTAAPVAIDAIQGHEAKGATGIAFTVAGLASVVGAFGVARLVGRPGQVRLSLALVTALAAVAHVMLGLSSTVIFFTVWFALTSLAQGAMLPATNTVIAAAVPYERRGTAFGIASSVQALAFIVGPWGAALFAAVSLDLGFILLGLLLAGTALATFAILREPDLDETTTVRSTESQQTQPPRREAPTSSG
jgi:DHA1 family multidrug resistance protein-like MFS transporter